MLTDTHKWLILAGLLLTGWLLYLLAPVLTPFLIAATLAYLGDPLVDWLEKRKLSRTLSVIVVFTVMTLMGLVLLLILLPLLQEQVIALLRRIPEFIQWLQVDIIPALLNRFGIESEAVKLDSISLALKENWRDVGSTLGLVLGKLGDSGQAILAWLAYIVLIPVVTFYLLRDWDKLVRNIHALVPRRVEPTLTKLVKECDAVLAEFLRGQLLVMLALAAIYTIGLWLVGLEFALLIGIGAGLVSFVPYLGSIVGIGIAGAVAFTQFYDVTHLVYVGLVFGIGQAIEGMLLSPLLVGDRIGLHPVAVIFAVMAGGQLFGFFGVLLALPVAAIITVLLRFFHTRYTNSEFYTP